MNRTKTTTPRKAWRSICWLAGCSGAIGCSLTVDGGRSQCQETIDCATELTGTDGLSCNEGLCVVIDPWACAGNLAPPQPGAPPQDLRVLVQDGQSGAVPIVGARLTPCAGDDPLCAQPVGPTATTGTDGGAHVRWDDHRFGYLEIELDGYMSILAMVSEQEKEAGVLVEPLPMFTRAAYNILAALTGTDADTENLGFIVVAVQACEGQIPSGVTVRPSRRTASTLVYHLSNGVASPQPTATDASGLAGLLNLPPGTLVISGVVDGERVVGHSGVIIRAGWISAAPIYPNGPP